MDIKKITKIFILVIGVAIGVYDVYAIGQGGTEASISQTIYIWAYKYPAFTFFMGFICGHLFWQMRITEASKKISAFVTGMISKKELTENDKK